MDQYAHPHPQQMEETKTFQYFYGCGNLSETGADNLNLKNGINNQDHNKQ